MSFYDFQKAVQQANDHIWDSLQERAMHTDGKPTKEEALRFVSEGVEMLLKHMQLTNPKITSVKAEDHVKIEIEDLNGQMTKVAIHMEARSEPGETIMFAFGYGPEQEQGAVN